MNLDGEEACCLILKGFKRSGVTGQVGSHASPPVSFFLFANPKVKVCGRDSDTCALLYPSLFSPLYILGKRITRHQLIDYLFSGLLTRAYPDSLLEEDSVCCLHSERKENHTTYPAPDRSQICSRPGNRTMANPRQRRKARSSTHRPVKTSRNLKSLKKQPRKSCWRFRVFLSKSDMLL